MRGRQFAFLVLAAFLVLSACGGSGKSAKNTPAPTTRSSTPTSTRTTKPPAVPVNTRDGGDPLASRCSKGAQSAPGAVVIKMPDGKPYGILRLRTSPSCHTAWGRVEAIKFRDVELHIDAVRPADRKTVAFSTTKATARENVFGHMLGYTTTACVQAKAQIAGGPVAATTCFKG